MCKRRKGEGGGGRREGERDIRGPKNVCLMLLMVCPLTRGQPLVVEQPIVTLSYGEREGERERERGRNGERGRQRLGTCIDEERCLSPYRHLLLLIS